MRSSAAGARVVTFGWSEAWAELRAVDTAELAVVPATVDLTTDRKSVV